MPARHAGPVGDRRTQARKLVASDRRHGVALHDQVGPRHQVRIGVRRRRVEDPDLVAVRLEVRDEQVRRLDGRVAVPAPADDDGELRWGSRHAGRGLRSNGGMGGRRDPRVRAGRRGRRVISGDSPGGHRPSSITAPASAAALAAASIRRTAGLAARPRRLKRWLACQPAAVSLAWLQAQVDAFQRGSTTSGVPTGGCGRQDAGHFRLRYDVTDSKGALTLPPGRPDAPLKVGAAHARTRVLAIVDPAEVTVVALDTGEILSAHQIEPGQGLLAQHTTRPRPMAGAPAHRLITRCRRCRDSCVADVATQDSGAPDRCWARVATYQIPIEGREK